MSFQSMTGLRMLVAFGLSFLLGPVAAAVDAAETSVVDDHDPNNGRFLFAFNQWRTVTNTGKMAPILATIRS